MTEDDIRNLVAGEIDRQDLTRGAVGVAAGMTPAALSNWLNGRKDINVGTLARVMQVLELKITPRRSPCEPTASRS